MEKSLEKSTNEEITVLKLKLDILENQLQLALDRAEMAESELKKLYNSKTDISSSLHKKVDTKPSLPPPPPPPLPKSPLYTNNSFKAYKIKPPNKTSTLVNDHCKIQNQQVESTGG